MRTKTRLLLPLVVMVPGVCIGIYGVLSSLLPQVLPKTLFTAPCLFVGVVSVPGAFVWLIAISRKQEALLNSVLSQGEASSPQVKYVTSSWGIAIDPTKQTATFADWYQGEPRKRCLRCDEIREVRLELNEFQRVEEDRTPGAGGMIVGMQMYGLLGAVVGGYLTSKKRKTRSDVGRSLRLTIRTGAESNAGFSGIFHLYNRPIEELYRVFNFCSALSVFEALSRGRTRARERGGEEDVVSSAPHVTIGQERQFLTTEIGRLGEDGKFTALIPMGAILPSEHSMLVPPDGAGKIRFDYYQCSESPRRLRSCEVTGVAARSGPIELIIQVRAHGRVLVYARNPQTSQWVAVRTAPVQEDLPYDSSARRWRPCKNG